MLRVPKRKRGRKTASHNRAPKQEKELANRFGGKTVKGSGCGHEKGDVRTQGVTRVEAKCTKHKSFSVTREMVSKIEDAAMGAGELPIIVVEFIESSENPKQELAVIPTWALDILLGD